MKCTSSLIITLLLFVCQAKSEEGDAVEGKGDRRWIGNKRCSCHMVYLPDYPSYDNSDFRQLGDDIVQVKAKRKKYAGDCKCDDGIKMGEWSATDSTLPGETKDRILPIASNYNSDEIPNVKWLGEEPQDRSMQPFRDQVFDYAYKTDHSLEYNDRDGYYIHAIPSPRYGFQRQPFDKLTRQTNSRTTSPLLKYVTSSSPLKHKHDDYVNQHYLKDYRARHGMVTKTVKKSADEGRNGAVDDVVTVIDKPLKYNYDGNNINRIVNDNNKVRYRIGGMLVTKNSEDSNAKFTGKGNFLGLRYDDAGIVTVADKPSMMRFDEEKFGTKLNQDENISGAGDFPKRVYASDKFSAGDAKTSRYNIDGTLFRAKRESEMDDKNKMMLEQQDDAMGSLTSDGNVVELMKMNKNKSADYLEKVGLGLGIASDVVRRVGEQVGATIVGIPAQMVLNQVSTGLKIGSETANTVAQSKRSSGRRKREVSFETWRKSSRTRGRTIRTTRQTVPSPSSSS